MGLASLGLGAITENIQALLPNLFSTQQPNDGQNVSLLLYSPAQNALISPSFPPKNSL